MALCQPYPFSETAKQNVRCQVLISLQLTVASRPTSQSGHRVFSVFCGSAEAHPAQCRSLLRLAWDGILRIAFFFSVCQETQQRNTCGRRDLQEEVCARMPLQNLLDAWHPCRDILPRLLLSTWKVQRPDRQLFSPLPAFPFSSLCSPWKCPFSAFNALSASPSLSSDCSTSGTTQFHSFVSLPLMLVMSGPRAIGIFRLPWKKYHRHFQTPLEKHNTVPDVILSC